MQYHRDGLPIKPGQSSKQPLSSSTMSSSMEPASPSDGLPSASSAEDEADSSLDLEVDDLNDLEDSMRSSQSIDDFTRMITDFRLERSKRRGSSIAGGRPRSGGAEGTTPNASGFLSLADATRTNRRRAGSNAGSDAGSDPRRSMDSDSMSVRIDRRRSWRGLNRCTCCCGQDGCDRAKRATAEWAEMEQDLRLAAGE